MRIQLDTRHHMLQDVSNNEVKEVRGGIFNLGGASTNDHSGYGARVKDQGGYDDWDDDWDD